MNSIISQDEIVTFQKSNTVNLLLIGSGILVIIMVLILIFILKRKKNK